VVKLFRAKGLCRSDFTTIANGLSVTPGFRKTMQVLKENGIKVAIVSGGIDTLLEVMVPDYKSIFENRVYINRFVFDEKGLVVGVDATDYDFAGKVEAIEKICVQEGFRMDEVVFVGDSRNDNYVLGKVGCTIAFMPTSEKLKDHADAIISEPDLEQLLEHVLGSSESM
jgi:HAD superfamily phosphoserine phosphatase-like hydrolase